MLRTNEARFLKIETTFILGRYPMQSDKYRGLDDDDA
jgi:hypothetical protein